MSTIGSRIKEERVRLGMTQPQFAEASISSKRALIEWEKNATSPSTVQLSALHHIGADVLYIVTGRREANVPERIDAHRLATAIEAVEEGLDAAKRTMPPDKKAELIKAAYDLISQPETGKGKVVELLRLVA